MLIGIAVLMALFGFAVLALAFFANANHPTGHSRDAGEVAGWGVALILIAVCLGLIHLYITPARAQDSRCAPWAKWAPFLKESHGETPIGGGAVSDKVAVAVMASPAGTFTILVVDARGIACAIASGDSWDPGRLPESAVAGKEG